MLNGIDPLIIIVLKVAPPDDLLGIPLPEGVSSLIGAIGLPIPIYLAERPRAALGNAMPGGAGGKLLSQSAIIVESETRSIDLETTVEATTAKDPLTGLTANPKVTQRALDTQVTVNLVASRDSILITALIAMMEFLLSRLQSKEYSIHYINKSTVIFGGLLNRFATSTNPNEDKIQVELVLSTAKKELPTAIPPKIPIAATSSVSLSTPPAP